MLSTGSFSGPCRRRARNGLKCSWLRIALLDAYAKYQFKRNIETGRGDDNARLSETQNDLIDALAKLVATDAAGRSFAVQRLAEHLQPWIEQDHWPVAEAAFAALQKALPAASRGTRNWPSCSSQSSRSFGATSVSCGPA